MLPLTRRTPSSSPFTLASSAASRSSSPSLPSLRLKLTLSSFRRYKLDDIQEAYDSMVEGKARFRSVITFDA